MLSWFVHFLGGGCYCHTIFLLDEFHHLNIQASVRYFVREFAVLHGSSFGETLPSSLVREPSLMHAASWLARNFSLQNLLFMSRLAVSRFDWRPSSLL
eukprot:1150773-Pelagomonas_calceolata.AAC.1